MVSFLVLCVVLYLSNRPPYVYYFDVAACNLQQMWPLIPSVLLYFAPTTALSFAVCNIPLATAVAEFRKHLIADKKEDGSDAEKVDGKNE